MNVIRKVPFNQASRISIVLFSAILIYHLLILVQVIPYEMTWGGRLESVDQMYRFETISLGLNFLFLLIVGAKTRMVRKDAKSKWLNGLLWVMVVLFSLNTLGNLFSLNSLEAYIFTPVTFILAGLCWRLAVE